MSSLSRLGKYKLDGLLGSPGVVESYRACRADGGLPAASEAERFVVKLLLSRWKGEAAKQELPEVPCVCHIWPAANWHEREAYDLGGVLFKDHPNLVRILMADDWVGYPLRKDYEYPLEYHGIRCR